MVCDKIECECPPKALETGAESPNQNNETGETNMKTNELTPGQREAIIMTVKRKKADIIFQDNVKTYGSLSAALRALDCTSKEEAIEMLSEVQTVSIFKMDGKVVIQ